MGARGRQGDGDLHSVSHCPVASPVLAGMSQLVTHGHSQPLKLLSEDRGGRTELETTEGRLRLHVRGSSLDVLGSEGFRCRCPGRRGSFAKAAAAWGHRGQSCPLTLLLLWLGDPRVHRGCHGVPAWQALLCCCDVPRSDCWMPSPLTRKGHPCCPLLLVTEVAVLAK